MILGILLVIFAALFQGTFLMPMAFMRKWAWEHNWAVFCLLAMLLMNWAIALLVLPNPLAIYAVVPSYDLWMLCLFGTAWGIGAVLFGLGMDKLGLALGYPLIMGLNAAVGAMIPLVWFGQGSLLTMRSLAVAAGTGIAIAGIILCSLAGARKEASSPVALSHGSAFFSGLLIAIAAGCLSGLPNIGMAFGKSAIAAARALGSREALAGNAVWALFFTFGGLVNLAYCALRMTQHRNFRALAGPETLRNLSLGAAMSLMWIGSFYCYGMGAAKMGNWGAVIGWPVLMSGSIGTGILWGLCKGEWTNAPASAGRLLKGGLLLILAAVLVLAYGNSI